MHSVRKAQNQARAWPSWRQALAWVVSGKRRTTIICPELGASWVAVLLKSLLANAGDSRHAGSIPGSGRSPGGGRGSPLQHSCLENPMDFLTQSQSPPQEFYIQSPPQLVNLSLSELRKLPLLIPGLLSIKWEGPADLPPGEVI